MTNKEKLIVSILKGEVKDLPHKFMMACPNAFVKTECKVCRDDDDCERCWEDFLNDVPSKRSKKKKKGNSSFKCSQRGY